MHTYTPFFTAGDVEVVHCTGCNRQINTNNANSVFRHPVLKVLLCKVFETIQFSVAFFQTCPFHLSAQQLNLPQSCACGHLQKCFNWYTSDIISKDDEGDDEQCTWCGDGGNLFICDCQHAICRNCVQRHLGRAELKRTGV